MRRNKFGAVPTEVDGITFHSRKESRRYQALKLMERAGLVRAIEVQPRFPLSVNGIAIGEYRADFRYIDVQYSEVVIEDVKGGQATKTPLYRWKVKHVKAEHGVTVVEV